MKQNTTFGIITISNDHLRHYFFQHSMVKRKIFFLRKSIAQTFSFWSAVNFTTAKSCHTSFPLQMIDKQSTYSLLLHEIHLVLFMLSERIIWFFFHTADDLYNSWFVIWIQKGVSFAPNSIAISKVHVIS